MAQLAHTLTAAPRLRLLPPMTDTDETRAADTMAPEADRDTLPPSAEERALTLLPAPRTIEDTYLERAIRVVAGEGEDRRKDREERQRQHNEVLDAIRLQGLRSDAGIAKVVADMSELAREMGANYEMLAGEFRRHRDVSDARDVEQDGRIYQLERQVAAMKGEILAALPEAMRAILAPYLVRIDGLEKQIAELKSDAARSATPEAAEPA